MLDFVVRLRCDEIATERAPSGTDMLRRSEQQPVRRLAGLRFSPIRLGQIVLVLVLVAVRVRVLVAG
jgi:hypothetical protein